MEIYCVRSLLHALNYAREKKVRTTWILYPLPFNNADLEASLTFIDKHMTTSMNLNIPISWKAIQYMVSDVQYGGKITDGLDREMFGCYTQFWIQEQIFTPNYCFNQLITEFNYHIPDAQEHGKFLEYIMKMPGNDSPPIFGLHANADLTFRLKESVNMIDVLLDTMPKDSGGGGGMSREEIVREKIEKELLPMLPVDFIWLDIVEKLRNLKGPKGLGESGKYDLIPLNIFLSQEIQRYMSIATIDGSIIMTPEIVDSINAVFDFRVPRKWQYDPTGAEISWLTASLAGWLKGLLDRHFQLNNW